MKYLSFSSPSQVQRYVVLVLAVTVLSIFSPLSQKANAKSTPIPWQNLTPSKLTQVWWQWLYSVPWSESPANDTTGGFAYNGQPYTDLLFLAGTTVVEGLPNGDVESKAERSIDVKLGTTLFFPLINGAFDNVCGNHKLGGNCFNSPKYPNVLGVSALRANVVEAVDAVVGQYANLTYSSGPTVGLLSSRLQSSPFSYWLPAHDNFYQGSSNLDISGTVAPAVADGYYASHTVTMTGSYLLEFGGQIPINDVGNVFKLAIIYRINVIQ